MRKPPRPAGTTKPLPRRHRIAHSPEEIQLHHSTEAVQTWHGKLTSAQIKQKYMTADPMICRATRKWLAVEVERIRWLWSREKNRHAALDPERSARGCTRIARSMRRNIRAGRAFQMIGEAELGPQAVDQHGNMSTACGCGSRSRNASARPCCG